MLVTHCTHVRELDILLDHTLTTAAVRVQLTTRRCKHTQQSYVQQHSCFIESFTSEKSELSLQARKQYIDGAVKWVLVETDIITSVCPE